MEKFNLEIKQIKDTLQKEVNNKTILYVNYPFCAQKCKYCIYFIDKFSRQKSDLFLECLEKEALLYSNILKNHKFLDFHIGGGTPNLVSPELILNRMTSLVDFKNIDRFVIEVFPRLDMDTYVEKLRKFNATKIQLGAQTLNDSSLKSEGRHTTRDTIIKNMEILSKSGFIWSVDLMNGFIDEKPNDYKRDLELVLSMRPTGIHLYDMRLQKENNFYSKNKTNDFNKFKKINLMHELGNLLLDSGYIKVGDEWCLKENKKNVVDAKKNMKLRGESNTIGLGLGGKSRIARIKYMNTKNLEEYKKNVFNKRLPIEKVFNYGKGLYSVANILLDLNGPLKFNLDDVFKDKCTTNDDKKEVGIMIDYLKKEGVNFDVTGKDYKLDFKDWEKCIFLIENYLERKAGVKYFYKN